MKIIWADHDPSLSVPEREELEAELAAAREFSRAVKKEEAKQEKSPARGFKEE
jgi:hypothetical protein